MNRPQASRRDHLTISKTESNACESFDGSKAPATMTTDLATSFHLDSSASVSNQISMRLDFCDAICCSLFRSFFFCRTRSKKLFARTCGFPFCLPPISRITFFRSRSRNISSIYKLRIIINALAAWTKSNFPLSNGAEMSIGNGKSAQIHKYIRCRVVVSNDSTDGKNGKIKIQHHHGRQRRSDGKREKIVYKKCKKKTKTKMEQEKMK